MYSPTVLGSGLVRDCDRWCSCVRLIRPLCMRSGIRWVICEPRFLLLERMAIFDALLCNAVMEGLFGSATFDGAISDNPLVILCGLNGLMFVEVDIMLGFLECCTPCTMDVWRWCPYGVGFFSPSTLNFDQEVCPVDVPLCGEAL